LLMLICKSRLGNRRSRNIRMLLKCMFWSIWLLLLLIIPVLCSRIRRQLLWDVIRCLSPLCYQHSFLLLPEKIVETISIVSK
jgi:hypothetical protein